MVNTEQNGRAAKLQSDYQSFINAIKRKKKFIYAMKRIIFILLTVFGGTIFAKAQTATTNEGVEINGIIWAISNVDTPKKFCSNPWESGMFYQWNRPIGWSNSDPMTNNRGETTWDESTPSGNTWEINICPSGWRLPTLKELESLLSSESLWGELNGVKGRFFGSGKQKVFFPAAGDRYKESGALYDVGNCGYYWSSTPFGNGAYCLKFVTDSFIGKPVFPRSFGFCVRCVLDK